MIVFFLSVKNVFKLGPYVEIQFTMACQS